MRLEITRRADLAVRAMALLVGDRRMKAADLAEALETTPGFVPQVVGPLVKAGWVRSDPGPTGGYALTPSAAGLSVLEVVEAVDGPTDDGRCVVADRACGRRNLCAMHTAWSRARDQLVETLGSMAVADVATVVR
jgi:Rrf2 family protein